jgi:protein translocase SecG subunit
MSIVVTVLPYVQIILSVIVVAGILLQYSSAGAGGAFGSADSFDSAIHTRRGAEKVIFITTIIAVVLFTITSILSIIL